MAQMKDKKQQLDEWFEEYGEDYITISCSILEDTEIDIEVKDLYRMFKLGIELGYEPEENDND